MGYLDAFSKSLANTTKKAAAHSKKVWDKHIKVPTKISDERMDICMLCDKLKLPTKQCTECGCFMVAKTMLPQSECPIGKWKAHHINVVDNTD